MFINKLRELRKRAGFSSAAAFSSAIGRPSSTVTSHENGSRRISKEDLDLYCKFLSVQPEDIIGDSANHVDVDVVARYVLAFCAVQKRSGKRLDLNKIKQIIKEINGVCFIDNIEMELIIESML